jgi:tetratricopeptide (TPR) repeat protein
LKSNLKKNKTQLPKPIKPVKMKNMKDLPSHSEFCSNFRAGNSSVSASKHISGFCLVRLLILFLMMPLFCGASNLNAGIISGVMDAYELRKNGKAEEARELLEKMLLNDSTNAPVWFELARTKHHMFLGGSQFTADDWKGVVDAAGKAVKYAPENEIYAYYYAYCRFFDAFISMMQQQPDASEKIGRTCDAFNAVLRLNPECHPAQLYLIDIYNYLPEEMGGNKEKAGIIVDDLGNKDKIYGAIAKAKLLPESANLVEYWQNVGNEVGMGAQVLEELGRAHLLKSNTENGTKYFTEAMQADPAKWYLTMHLVRYHLISTQQDPDNRSAHLEEATKLINNYLELNPELIAPLKAYLYGTLALIRMIDGDNGGSNEYREKAASIDPYYSKATGMAPEMLYCRPDEVKIQYSSFFLPF